jgi:hypothetical protein
MDYRQLLRALSFGRIGVGTALLVAPGAAGRRWIGDAARLPEVKVIARAFGVRDLALGIGTLQALDAEASPRTWVSMGVLSDAADLVATTLAIRRLGLRRALPVMVVAAGAATLGYLAQDQVD